METNSLLLTPFFIEVDGCEVTIFESLKREMVTGQTWFFVVVSIDYKGIKTRRYTLAVRDTQDLINKLKIEITKIKFMEYAYGLDYVKRLIT